MTEISEKKLNYYLKCLEDNYIYRYVYDNENKDKINHVKIIIELLDGNPKKLWKENFLYEVEKYERQNFGNYVRSRTLHHIKTTIEKMRKDPELVKVLCNYYKEKNNNNILIKIKNFLLKKM